VVLSQWITTRQALTHVKFDQERLKRQRQLIDQNCAGLRVNAYGQELARRHSPQAGFLIRYMGQPYAARAKIM